MASPSSIPDRRAPGTGRRPGRGVIRVTPLLLAGVALLSACVAGDVPAAPSDDAQLVEGQAIYTSNCVSCHGAAGGGGAGTKLSGGEVLEHFPRVEDQLTVVADGRNAMPAFDGKLTDSEIEAVVAYTREVLATQG